MTIEYNRIPFLILPYSERDKAIPKELMMDFDTGQMYVRSIDGTKDIPIGSNTVLTILESELENLLDGVGIDGDTLKKLEDLIKLIQEWKDTLDNEDYNNRLNIIYDKLKDLPDNGSTILDLLNGKVDKIHGYGLTDNDFNKSFYDKLMGIEFGANNYDHPNDKVCNYELPVVSVNNKSDDHVIITKEDLGLGNVEEGANYYTHPAGKQCNAISITSINNKTGPVILDKSNIELGNVENYSIATISDISSKVSNKYITPVIFKSFMDKFIADNPPPNKYTLTFNITPKDTKITVNSELWSVTSKQIYESSYSYYIEKPGYVPETGMVTLNKNTTITVALQVALSSINVVVDSTYINRIPIDEPIDTNKLIVTAIYSDGTSKVISADKYKIEPVMFTTIGNNILKVQYTENNITKTANINVKTIKFYPFFFRAYGNPGIDYGVPIGYDTNLDNKVNTRYSTDNPLVITLTNINSISFNVGASVGNALITPPSNIYIGFNRFYDVDTYNDIRSNKMTVTVDLNTSNDSNLAIEQTTIVWDDVNIVNNMFRDVTERKGDYNRVYYFLDLRKRNLSGTISATLTIKANNNKTYTQKLIFIIN